MVHFRAETTKGGKYRAVPICEELAHALRCRPRGDGIELLFTWRGRPLRSIRTAFENAREAAGLGRDVVVHTLRHTFCSNYVMDGGDIYALRDLAGHGSVAVTSRYAHLSAAHILKSGAFIGAPKGTDTGD
jgi:site-specific recombinase XerD